MPRNRKCFTHGNVYEITIRCLKGIPLTAAPFVKRMLEGVLGRAQEYGYVTVSHIVMMGNHAHIIIVVADPHDVPRFMSFFKGRSAHLINKLLGTTGQVWEQRYFSAIIRDLEMLMDRLVYFYTNPQQANLVERIDDYPQISSWQAMLNNGEASTVTAGFMRVKDTPTIPPGRLNKRRVRRYTRLCKEAVWCKATFTVEPRAAFRTFGCDEEDIDRYIQRVIERVRLREEELIAFRREQGKTVLGRKKLIYADLHKEHTPKKRGRKLICLASCPKDRANYIRQFKAWAAWCKEVYELWKDGFIEEPFPLGGFPPPKPHLARALHDLAI